MIRKHLKDFDMLLSYDQVSYNAMEQHTPKRVHHEILQGGYWSDRWPLIEDRDWSGPFRFIMVGQLHARKNPFLAVRAFTKLKEKHGKDFDAELHLKTNIRGLHPAMEDAYPGVKVHYRWFSHEELVDFYRKSHCYLAISYGEGKNMPALETLSTGMSAIVTPFGGHSVWFNPEFAYGVEYARSEDWMGICAQTDEDSLAEQMWHVYQNREEAREKGLIASRTLPAMCDWSVVARKFVEAVKRGPSRDVGDSL